MLLLFAILNIFIQDVSLFLQLLEVGWGGGQGGEMLGAI
jgi:hypothetical protein